MILNKQIPKDFYKLFRTKNMDAYMMFLVEIYNAGNDIYTSLGLTIEEGKAIIRESISRSRIVWQEDAEDSDEGLNDKDVGIDFLYKNQTAVEQANEQKAGTPSSILRRLISWGWLESDYDERLNTYMLSFPEYSQLYVELFEKLSTEDNRKERESILSIYSALFTYKSDREKNNDILRTAFRTAKNLERLLNNMQNGMRSYFDELSRSRNFIDIQQVLVDEINNSDSKKYAILTTTDSFYRYKEAVKELISQILCENDLLRDDIEKKQKENESNQIAYFRNEKALEYCEEAARLVYSIEREFDVIERKYNKLIEQKAIFAKRALARIRYIFQEGAAEEDNVLKLIRLIDARNDKDEILEAVGKRIRFTTPFKTFNDNSMYKRRNAADKDFSPVATEHIEQTDNDNITDFVPRPLYTRKQLHEFRDKNVSNGVFRATKETVNSMEDLEKMMFLWQELTQEYAEEDIIELGKELTNETGFTFSELMIHLKN